MTNLSEADFSLCGLTRTTNRGYDASSARLNKPRIRLNNWFVFCSLINEKHEKKRWDKKIAIRFPDYRCRAPLVFLNYIWYFYDCKSNSLSIHQHIYYFHENCIMIMAASMLFAFRTIFRLQHEANLSEADFSLCMMTKTTTNRGYDVWILKGKTVFRNENTRSFRT